MWLHILALAAPSSSIVDITPSESAAEATIPLTNTIQTAASGIGWLALVFALLGLLISAGLWAIGSYSNNFQQTVNGKRGVAVSAAAALIIGLAAVLVNSFYILGSSAN